MGCEIPGRGWLDSHSLHSLGSEETVEEVLKPIPKIVFTVFHLFYVKLSLFARTPICVRSSINKEKKMENK